MNFENLTAKSMVKHYGGVIALSDGNLEVTAGEVMALVGANGSGKSTLSKIITGVVAPDGGELLLNGHKESFSSPQAARKKGIEAVYQELSLIPRMKVSDNIWIGNEMLSKLGVVDSREIRRRTNELLSLFEGVFSDPVDPDMHVQDLSPSDRQIVEILKAISLEPNVLILDEATASLDTRQVNRLFELIGEWKKRDMGIVFISHRMEEIFRVADRVTVLRSGKTMGVSPIDEISERDLVELMIEGGVVEQQYREGRKPALEKVKVKVDNLESDVLHGVSLKAHAGEIVGLGGLQGQGQSELLLSLFGAASYYGKIEIEGEPTILKRPTRAMKKNIAYVPGDRNVGGLLPVRSILENLLITTWEKYGFPLKIKKAKKDAQAVAEGGLNLVMGDLDDPVSSLSGGNAQKVVLGKWLIRNPEILLLDDPTKGVDVGAKGEFYRILSDLREQGAAILFYSSDDDELLGLCDRVYVFQDGKITAELSGSDLTRSNLVSASMGGTLTEAVHE